MELGKLGTITDANGDARYNATKNPLLQIVFGHNPLGWGDRMMNPDTYATLAAADAIAKALGGEVVTDPMSARFNTTGRMLAIQLPEREPVNAGAACAILGNDCAFANAGSKSGAICELFHLPFDPGMADKLCAALFPQGM